MSDLSINTATELFCYEGNTKEWILKGSIYSTNAVYSPQLGDDAIGPPNGEWSSHNGKDGCNAKGIRQAETPAGHPRDSE